LALIILWIAAWSSVLPFPATVPNAMTLTCDVTAAFADTLAGGAAARAVDATGLTTAHAMAAAASAAAEHASVHSRCVVKRLRGVGLTIDLPTWTDDVTSGLRGLGA
jgi:hypothetical protein